MEEIRCKHCQYFIQHYALCSGKLTQVYCGHCTYQRIKTKRPDAKACEHYLFSESAAKAFAAKEYLSKALLEYMLKLELLPEIYEIEEQ